MIPHAQRKRTRLGAMGLHPCIRTEALAKACLMKPQHCKSTGFDRDDARVEKMMPSLLKTLARNILKKDSLTVKNATAESTARLYYRMDARSRLTKISLRIVKNLPAFHYVFPHVAQLISQSFCHKNPHENALYIPCSS